jgi:hypothetical protein
MVKVVCDVSSEMVHGKLPLAEPFIVWGWGTLLSQ